jgi:ATP-dependent RNA helicase RhlE
MTDSTSQDITAPEAPVPFAQFGLHPGIMQAIEATGYVSATPIQAKAIPIAMSGRDVMGAAQTGTGKTAAFSLPILHRLMPFANSSASPARHPVRALILTPTRELADQVHANVAQYSRFVPLRTAVVFGGVDIRPQRDLLRQGCEILIATPGRLLDHVEQRNVNLGQVGILVLDEADRMLDMGFIHDIRRVLKLLPAKRQNLLFSATFSDEIRVLAQGILRNPGEVSVARRNTTSELVSQRVVMTEQAHKRDLLSHIIRESGWHQVLVFTRTKHGANRLAEKLSKDGLTAAAIHGNKSQAARTKALSGFKDGKVAVLVATDIAARGLDIDQLPQVVNFELPNVPEDYVHRIGRTGRAGSTGSALSLVDQSEVKLLRAIERLIKQTIEPISVEGWNPSAMVTADSAPDAREKRAIARLQGDFGGGRGDSGRRNDGGRRDAPGRDGRRPASSSASGSNDRRSGPDARRSGGGRAPGGRPTREGGAPQAPRRDARPASPGRSALLRKD